MIDPEAIINRKKNKLLTIDDIPQITIKTLVLILLRKGVIDISDLDKK